MTTLEKLEWLIGHCLTVTVDANSNRSYYRTVAQYFDEEPRLLPLEARAACVESDSIVTVQVYPRTPIGFNFYVGPDLASAVGAAYQGECGTDA